MDFTIETHGFDEAMRRLDKFPQVATRELVRAMEQSVRTVEGEVKPLTPVGVSAMLRNSIGSEVSADIGGTVVGRIGSSMKDEIYPRVMEYGREPGHWISAEGMESLIRWVHVKGLAGSYSTKTRRRKGSQFNQLVEDATVAGAIAMAIYRRGIKGRHFLSTGFNRSRVRVIEYFEAAQVRIAKAMMHD
jgi:hypothetical protein